MIIIKILFLLIILYTLNYFMQKNNTHKFDYIKKNGYSKRIIKYKDLSDILFNIEGYYSYNQQAYIDLLKYTDLFLEIYELIQIESHYATNLNNNLVDLKREIVNTLISFEITLPREYNLNDVITDYIKIIDKYLYNVYVIHEEYIKKNKMDYTIKLIYDVTHKHPSAYNNNENILDPKKYNYFNYY